MITRRLAKLPLRRRRLLLIAVTAIMPMWALVRLVGYLLRIYFTKAFR